MRKIVSYYAFYELIIFILNRVAVWACMVWLPPGQYERNTNTYLCWRLIFYKADHVYFIYLFIFVYSKILA